MLKMKPNCVTCALIRGGDKQLEHRINVSTVYNPNGESLLSIYKEYFAAGKLSGAARKTIYNHAKKHQAPSAGAQARVLAKDALAKVQGDKAVETVKLYTNHSQARTEILEKVMQAVAAGDIKLTSSLISPLLKQEADIEEKAKDRTWQAEKMVAYFASRAGMKALPVTLPDLDAL